MPDALQPDYLAQCEIDARKFQGAWCGTSGNLAAHVMRLLKEVQRLKCELAQREQREPYWLRPHD
jgi:hypothetical protein